eukprot:6205789-Pleurochrysis_carterae.AAC.5
MASSALLSGFNASLTAWMALTLPLFFSAGLDSSLIRPGTIGYCFCRLLERGRWVAAGFTAAGAWAAFALRTHAWRGVNRRIKGASDFYLGGTAQDRGRWASLMDRPRPFPRTMQLGRGGKH